MAKSTLRRCLFVVSKSATPCGVEAFALKLTAALQLNHPDEGYDLLKVSGQFGELNQVLRRMAQAECVVFNLPLVAWKRTIVLPWILLLSAFFRRQKVFVFLHEWSSLHPLRRLVFIPFVLFSRTIVFLSPYIRDQFTSDRWVGWARGKCSLSLHAPTVRRPGGRRVTDLVRRVEQLRSNKAIVIGQFGSIYKGKGTDALLDVCAYLRRQGAEASVVFIGATTKSLDNYESDFRDKVKNLGLENSVIITGYIDDDEQLFAIFDHVDVFLYIFPEGLTARRSSVLASLQSGKPVVVSAPTVANEFRHHPGYTSLIEKEALVFFPPTATTEQLAGTISSAAAHAGRTQAPIDYDAWWKEASSATKMIFDAGVDRDANRARSTVD